MTTELFPEQIQGTGQNVLQINDFASKVYIEPFIGGNTFSFLYHGTIEGDIAGSIINFRDTLEYNSFTREYDRVQVLEIGTGDRTIIYSSIIPQKEVPKLREQAYLDEPFFVGKLDLIG